MVVADDAWRSGRNVLYWKAVQIGKIVATLVFPFHGMLLTCKSLFLESSSACKLEPFKN